MTGDNMNIYNSRIFMSDIERTAENMELEKLYGSSVLITGASGLICSGIADILFYANTEKNAGIDIYLAGRSEDKMRERFARYADTPHYHFVSYDAAEASRFDFHVDYIIHGASNASPGAIQREPVETMTDNIMGVKNLLEYAKSVAAKRLLFVSSSEVYGNTGSGEPFTESDYGYTDILNPRSSYSVGKMAAETMCASFTHEYGLDTVIARPGHIYGPTASRADNRVASLFAYAAAQRRDLVLKSDGAQLRSYCYMLDCDSAILTILLKGDRGEAYNISNPASVMTIRQMAERYAEYGGVKLIFDMPTAEERAAFNPMANSSLDSRKLTKLGWRGLFDGEEGIGHTVSILKEII